MGSELPDHHEHEKHSSKCMREAVRLTGHELHSYHHFAYVCIYWLTQYGTVSISGNDEVGWTVQVESDPEKIWEQPDTAICSGGHSLNEAICGAVHAIPVAHPPATQ